MQRIRPFLKWAGNKYRILNQILCHFPRGKRLIEPFAGSASIFLNSNYSNYLIAEVNQDLIGLFQCLQKDGSSFIDYCETFFQPKNNSATQYYQLRAQFNQCTEAQLRAAIFLYLNRHGYNGLCRYNHKGIYNVPFGRYIKPYFPRIEMTYFYKKSHAAEFLCLDFEQTFKLANIGDVIYCDPPYVPREQSSNFAAYTKNVFREEEQIKLVELSMDAAARGIPVIISNHDTNFTRHHYRHGKIKSFAVKRSISSNPKYRTLVPELIVIFQDTGDLSKRKQ